MLKRIRRSRSKEKYSSATENPEDDPAEQLPTDAPPTDQPPDESEAGSEAPTPRPPDAEVEPPTSEPGGSIPTIAEDAPSTAGVAVSEEARNEQAKATIGASAKGFFARKPALAKGGDVNIEETPALAEQSRSGVRGMIDRKLTARETRATAAKARTESGAIPTEYKKYPVRFENVSEKRAWNILHKKASGDGSSSNKLSFKQRMANRAFAHLQKKVVLKLESMYTEKIKPGVTADRRTPWPLRVAIHELVDELWGGLQVEVERVFEKLISDGKHDEEEEGKSAPPSPPGSPPETDSSIEQSSIRGDPSLDDPAFQAAWGDFESRALAKIEAVLSNFHDPGCDEWKSRPVPLPSPPMSPPEHEGKGDTNESITEGDAEEGVGHDEMVEKVVEEAIPGSAPIVLTLTLKSAAGIMAADRNGKSDPFVKMSFGSEKHSSKVCYKTLDPVWNASFEFKGTKEMLLSQPVTLDVRDYDGIASKSDPLGWAELDVSVLQPNDNTQEFTLDLADDTIPGSRGSIIVAARYVVVADKPRHRGPPFASPIAGLLKKTPAASPADDKPISLFCLLESGSGLAAADKNGFSDPFVRLTVNKVDKSSKVAKETLDPVWEQEFSWTGARSALLGAPMKLKVKDDDGFARKTQLLGSAEIDLLPVLDALKNPGEERMLEVPLDTQGSLKMRLWWRPAQTASKNPFHLRSNATGDYVRVRVTLGHATGLMAADKNGLSDPYVKLILGTDKKTSKVIKKTLEPVWEQEFQWKVLKETLASLPLKLELFDKDIVGNKDDSLGVASCYLSEIEAPGVPEDLALSLDTQGQVFVKVMWDPILPPKPQQPIGEVCGDLSKYGTMPATEPLSKWMKLLPWLRLRWEYSSVTLVLKVLAATGLRAADAGGTSDPYMTIRLNALQQWERRTRTVQKTVDPVWDESFTISGFVQAVKEKPMLINVYDDDIVSADDILGCGRVDLSPLVGPNAVKAGPPVKLCVPLEAPPKEKKLMLRAIGSSDQTARGNVYLAVEVQDIVRPTWLQVAYLFLHPVLRPVLELAALWREGCSDATVTIVLKSGRNMTGRDLQNKVGLKPGHLKSIQSGFEENEIKPKLKICEQKDDGRLFYEKPIEPIGMKHDNVWEHKITLNYKWWELTRAPLAIKLPIGQSGLREGVATVDLAAMESYAKDPDDFHRDVELLCSFVNPSSNAQVTTGKLQVGVTVKKDREPTYLAAFWMLVIFLIRKLYTCILGLPVFVATCRRNYTTLTMNVLVRNGVGLRAADRGGKSDPYLTLALGKHLHYTSVFPKSVNPVWEESFSFTDVYGKLTEAPLLMEVFDEDELSRDDSLGTVEFDLRLVPFFSEKCKEGVDFSLPLSSQGDVSISVRCSDIKPPSNWLLFRAVVVDPLLRLIEILRHFILYYRMPYDRTVWAKLRDPWTIVVMYIAASPDIFIRGLFFTFFLLCIIHDRDEFQLMRYILGLKGSQFISGLLKGLIGYIDFWVCASGDCRVDGPGVGQNVVEQMMLLTWLQLLLWTAFVLLPYASHLNPQTGRLSYERGKRLWKTNYATSLIRAQARWSDSNDKGLIGGANRYMRLVEDVELGESDQTDTTSGTNPADVEVCTSTADVAQALCVCFPNSRARPHALVLGVGLTIVLFELDATSRSWRSVIASKLLRCVSFVRGVLIEADAIAGAYWGPLYQPSTRNRMVSLLQWDVYMFIGQFALYYAMLFEFFSRRPDTTILQNALHTLTTYSGWQAELTYAVVKILFSLSAFPFFLFTIGPLSRLFTHTEATAYTRDGKLVPTDPNGLSAYLQWFKEDVLGVDRYHEELQHNFPRKDYDRIKKVLARSEACLKKAWQQPSTAIRITRKQKAELDGVLRSIITRESASDELYWKCFPDQVLTERYIEEKQASINETFEASTSNLSEATDLTENSKRSI